MKILNRYIARSIFKGYLLVLFVLLALFSFVSLIEELEDVRRGHYAGAVGYFGFNGNMDTCITIRTILMQGDVAYLQAGGGIVADSDPTREWEETLHKARALGVAIEMAEQGI